MILVTGAKGLILSRDDAGTRGRRRVPRRVARRRRPRRHHESPAEGRIAALAAVREGRRRRCNGVARSDSARRSS
jgi:hypothetical protein